MFLDAFPAGASDYRALRNGSIFDATTATTSNDVFTAVRLTYAAVPEPAEYAAWTGLSLLVLAGWRHRRRPAQSH